MSTVSTNGLPEGIDPVACYIGQRIIEKAYTYDFATTRWPKYKEGIIKYLEVCQRTDLIPGYIPPVPPHAVE